MKFFFSSLTQSYLKWSNFYPADSKPTSCCCIQRVEYTLFLTFCSFASERTTCTDLCAILPLLRCSVPIMCEPFSIQTTNSFTFRNRLVSSCGSAITYEQRWIWIACGCVWNNNILYKNTIPSSFRLCLDLSISNWFFMAFIWIRNGQGVVVRAAGGWIGNKWCDIFTGHRSNAKPIETVASALFDNRVLHFFSSTTN